MEHDTKTGLVKSGSAWLLVIIADLGIKSWGDVAAMLAALYSLVLIIEWVWKRIARPIAEAHGWVAPRKRHRIDTTGHGDL